MTLTTPITTVAFDWTRGVSLSVLSILFGTKVAMGFDALGRTQWGSFFYGRILLYDLT